MQSRLFEYLLHGELVCLCMPVCHTLYCLWASLFPCWLDHISLTFMLPLQLYLRSHHIHVHSYFDIRLLHRTVAYLILDWSVIFRIADSIRESWVNLYRVHSHAPSIRSHRGIKVVWPDFQPMRVPEEPVCVHLFRQKPVFTSLHLKSPVHVHRLSIQWETKLFCLAANRFSCESHCLEILFLCRTDGKSLSLLLWAHWD